MYCQTVNDLFLFGRLQAWKINFQGLSCISGNPEDKHVDVTVGTFFQSDGKVDIACLINVCIITTSTTLLPSLLLLLVKFT